MGDNAVHIGTVPAAGSRCSQGQRHATRRACHDRERRAGGAQNTACRRRAEYGVPEARRIRRAGGAQNTPCRRRAEYAVPETREGSIVRYQTIAEAYSDLEHVSGRLALVDRLAALLASTPITLLPTVCYLC